MTSFPAPGGLTDGVVSLEPMGTEHAEEFLAGATDPAVARFAYARSFDLDTARDYLAALAERARRGEAVQVAVRDATDGSFLGAVLLFHADWDRAVVEVGFWLLPAARGRGIAARALRLAFAWARQLGFERVYGQTDVANVPAQRALEAAGFTREGVLRGFAPHPEGRRDYVGYARLATDAGDAPPPGA